MGRLQTFFARNGRHVSTLVFAGGFIVDVIMLPLLDLSEVEILFAVYLAAAALLMLGSHAFLYRSAPIGLVAALVIGVLPLSAQFFLGALLSGLLIFYTESASLSASWPFLAVLAVVFLGNEVLRKYREQFAFQMVLFFFTLYAYAIFVLPVLVGSIGTVVFMGSGIVALLIFLFFARLLRRVGGPFPPGLPRFITLSVAGIVVFVSISYFAGILPPIPLALRDSGIYHQISRMADGYALTGEPTLRFVWRTVVHHVPGTPLFAYSAVFAPVSLTTAIAHRWERFDGAAGTWVLENRVSFPISGGRESGYRGYSVKNDPREGAWRVVIETVNGQRIGDIRFDIENVATAPATATEYR